jgi:hypothetical protein
MALELSLERNHSCAIKIHRSQTVHMFETVSHFSSKLSAISVRNCQSFNYKPSVILMWKILLLFILTDPTFPANFSLFIFTAKILMPCYSTHLISMDPCLSYINCCTAHYSAVMFYIRLEQIKVIALAHLAIIFKLIINYQSF